MEVERDVPAELVGCVQGRGAAPCDVTNGVTVPPPFPVAAGRSDAGGGCNVVVV